MKGSSIVATIAATADFTVEVVRRCKINSYPHCKSNTQPKKIYIIK